jgi:hypothetical protein
MQFFTDWRVSEVGTIDRKLIMHVDNARSHIDNVSLVFIEQNEMKVMKGMPHLPYSMDLALSDLFLLNDIKEILNGHIFQSADNLLSKIQFILVSIEKLSC